MTSEECRRQPPTRRAFAGFANGQPAYPLAGGMGVAWRAGDVVLKPSPGAAEARCHAKTQEGMVEVSDCRFQRPISVPDPPGGWEIDGWVAWR